MQREENAKVGEDKGVGQFNNAFRAVLLFLKRLRRRHLRHRLGTTTSRICLNDTARRSNDAWAAKGDDPKGCVQRGRSRRHRSSEGLTN
jgi:hypothetical protein